jgi:hypothetical protein
MFPPERTVMMSGIGGLSRTFHLNLNEMIRSTRLADDELICVENLNE